ncbi:hypothetical protein EVG20_g285 [Dentipellis fragilis]|uniref:Uncharacterized protein n=1 Tax=Dentipellis fragilis TaxID=205917 RepID=A0A4Y9ZE44_9AGAM|nr:hypothetical protein EVG20_g285 [Dentipellis fragilis]
MRYGANLWQVGHSSREGGLPLGHWELWQLTTGALMVAEDKYGRNASRSGGSAEQTSELDESVWPSPEPKHVAQSLDRSPRATPEPLLKLCKYSY